jgi:hypothetical protein
VPFDVDASYATGGGMSKGINCLQLRFSEFVTVITFCRLALGDGMLNLGSYNQKSTASSSRSTTHQSTAEAELGEELRRMKELVQQLQQSNQQMQHEYETMQYTMMQVIISTSAICQILIIVETEDLVINE